MRLLVLAVLFVAMAASRADAAPSVVPQPAHLTPRACSAPLALDRALRVAGASDDGGLALVRERWTALGIPAPEVNARGARLTLRLLAGGGERYTLAVRSDGVTIAGSRDGLFDGLTTLAQLPERDARGRWIVGCVDITDEPALRWRIVADDISRGPFPTMAYFRTRIRGLAAFKVNGYSPYMESVFADPSHPYVASPERLTPNELRDLAAYARRFHVTIVPSQQTLAHLHESLKYETLAPLAELPHGYLANPTDPRTDAYLAPLIRSELAAVGRVPFFNLNADEPLDLGRGRTPRTPQIFAEHVARVAALLGPDGPVPMIWDDAVQADPSILPLLPARTVLLAFHYGAEPSFARYLRTITDGGHDVMASPGANNWNEIFPDLTTAYANEAQFVADAKAAQSPHVLGMFETVWHDDGESLYEATWAPVVFAAASAWQERAIDRAQWHAAFARAFFGPDDAARYASDLDALQAMRDGLRTPPQSDPSDYLFWSDPFDRRIQARMTSVDVAALRVRAEAVLAHLETTRPALHASAAAVMRLAALRYDVLGRRFQIGAEARADYDDALAHLATHDAGIVERDLNITKYLCWELRDEMTALAPLYAAAWNAESRPGGRDRVLVRYARAAEIAVGEADRLNAANRESYVRAGTLPSFDDVLGAER